MKQRTSQQNKSLHKWFELVSAQLNDAGITVQLLLKERVELPVTPEVVKELLWRPAQRALLGKQSTTELSKQEDIDLVYDTLNRHLATRFHLENIPFPSHEVGYWDTAPLKHEEGTVQVTDA